MWEYCGFDRLLWSGYKGTYQENKDECLLKVTQIAVESGAVAMAGAKECRLQVLLEAMKDMQSFMYLDGSI